MLRARHLCCALVLASCAQGSRLDSVTSNASDPWSGGSAGSNQPAPKQDDPFGGFDIQGTFAKIAEAMAKPGPYEAPDKSADFAAAKPHWGVLRLGGEIVEREGWSFTGGTGTELGALIDRLRALAGDEHLTGVLLRFDSPALSLPDLVELRAVFHEFRKAGKQLACHAENASNASYLLLSACDRIGLAPLGDVAITGPAAMPIHVKPLLDKLGVRADFLHVGAYKGAAEPLTRDAPSKEMQEVLGAILDGRYRTMVDAIAADRGITAAAVQALIDRAPLSSSQARDGKLVDDVSGFEAFRDDALKGAPWTKLELHADKSDRLAMMMRFSRFLGALPPAKPAADHVAVVYALGDIIDGDGGGLLGARQEIAARTMVAALRALNADDSVKAVVLRIDSGGGSAQASELIWHEVNALNAKKPVVVSMSDVAASGGYYIASAASKIFALDDTLTGSIGVVGGKIAPRDALAKLGVNTYPIGRGKHATILASLGPWNDEERQTMQAMMQSVYRVFVERVAAGRHKSAPQILAIAEGRVWTGSQAKEIGLVDEIGGLDAALAAAAALGKVDLDSGLEVFPPAPTLRDVISSFGQVQAPLGLGTDAALAALAAAEPRVARATAHLIKLVLSFRTSSIQAVAVLPLLP